MRRLFNICTGLLFFVSLSSFAATCPTELKHDSANNTWYSTASPGWRSHRTTTPDVKLDPKNFGGAVYSPARQRIACVYKSSEGRWIALVSNRHEGFRIDKQAVDESGKRAAWQYNKQHDDFACGLPSVTKVSGCPFTLE